jgi:hypothetical protein
MGSIPAKVVSTLFKRFHLISNYLGKFQQSEIQSGSLPDTG